MNRKRSILLIEAQSPVSAPCRTALKREGYQLWEAGSIKAAEKALSEYRIDLLILDVLLPDGSGLDFCRSVRQSSPVPILFLSALAEPSQKVEGLRAGGDDYVTRPCHPEELIARVEALLRRAMLNSKAAFQTDGLRVYGPLRLDSTSYQAYVSDRKVPLAPREFLLVWYLAEHHGQVNSPDDLYWHVWGETPLNATTTLRVYINSLRRKLRLSEEPTLSLETEYGKGYRLVIRDCAQGM